MRFVDRMAPSGFLRMLGLHNAAFDEEHFYLLDAQRRRAQVDFTRLGEPCEIVCEREIAMIPLLIPMIGLYLAAAGHVLLHAASFVHRGHGVLVAGWQKGGKTEILLPFTAVGADFVADEWTVVGGVGQGMYGLSEVARLWAAAVVLLRDQEQAVTNLQNATIALADDVDDPPLDTWLVIRDARGQQDSTGGLPAGADDPAAFAAAVVGGPPTTTDRQVDGVTYRVTTERRTDGFVVQAVLDLTPRHDDRIRILAAMHAAGAAGLVLAAVAGTWLSRRALQLMSAALALQRRFVADAGHELRTPLTLLGTRAQLLRRRLQQVVAGDPPRAWSDSRPLTVPSAAACSSPSTRWSPQLTTIEGRLVAMTSNSEVLDRAIATANANGWKGSVVYPGVYRSPEQLIYSHDFARALWGKEAPNDYCKNSRGGHVAVPPPADGCSRRSHRLPRRAHLATSATVAIRTMLPVRQHGVTKPKSRLTADLLAEPWARGAWSRRA
ncbi:sensor histidine kinase family protein [Pseudonocardia charpentierae]|uniref:histidine kinase n=1 Tax=Pseudonocardia charpentierae TaxID=3075545 RepID=A0ABU2NHD6_9PSEU|nr:hypothetical protein [Pseudonocardia sp. DSM 45834]MDT0353299.1 hypothetical protein [Pseudonocardia sp. DSM 45834]